MNKALSILSLFLLSQFVSAQEISVGPELGLNILPLDQTDLGNDYGLGFYGGATIRYSFSDQFSLNTGFYFTQTKHTYSSSDTSVNNIVQMIENIIPMSGIDLNTYTTIQGRVQQNYIQMPLTASYTWNGLSVSAGGYLAYMIGGNRKERTESRTPWVSVIDIASFDSTGFLSFFIPPAYTESSDVYNTLDNHRMWDYGIIGKLSYEMNHVLVSASYNFGLPDHRIKYEGNKQTNRYFQFSAAYLIPIMKSAKNSRVD